MLAPAKRTSAPRSSVFIDARSFSKRSLRNRSKSTRYCQSAPVWLYRRRGSHSCGCPKNLVSIMFKTSFLLDDVKCWFSYSVFADDGQTDSLTLNLNYLHMNLHFTAQRRRNQALEDSERTSRRARGRGSLELFNPSRPHASACQPDAKRQRLPSDRISGRAPRILQPCTGSLAGPS